MKFKSLIKEETLMTISRTGNKMLAKAGKHSPVILLVVGGVTIIAGTVAACKATLKSQEVLVDAKEKIDTIHALQNGEKEVKEGETYTEQDAKTDICKVYTNTGVRLAKNYGPAVLMVGTGLACMVGSHHIMSKRNAALVAAYTTIDSAFKEYKGRVEERFGTDVEKELEHGIRAEEVTMDISPAHDGTSIVKASMPVADGYSPYAQFFDENSEYYFGDIDTDLVFLKTAEDTANRRLKTRGYMFLNDVYDILGIKRTSVGQIVGWVYSPMDPDCQSYIDFGIRELIRKRADDPEFHRSYRQSFLLDFNVDGEIINKI